MTAPLFLVDAAALAADRVVLDGPEGRHAARVRRLAAGERVDVADGAGHVAECIVVVAERDALVLDVARRRAEPEPSPRFVVVQALAKGERAELAVEMLTEVGADAVVPWAAERSVAQWRGERGERALQRWRSTAREAAKQARRARVPDVLSLAGTPDVAALLRGAALGLVLHEEAAAPLSAVSLPGAGDVVLVVGPEGGLSDREVAELVAAGGVAARLGPTVLRTSTAGVAALAALLARTPRWS